MNNKRDEFFPDDCLPLTEAVEEVGRKLIDGWSGRDERILAEVLTSWPGDWRTLPLTSDTWPDRGDMPNALDRLIKSVWESSASSEYLSDLNDALQRWPNRKNPAMPRLERLQEIFRQWVGQGRVAIVVYPMGGGERRNIGLNLATDPDRNSTQLFYEMLATGKEPVRMVPEGRRPKSQSTVFVPKEDLEKVLAATPVAKVRQKPGRKDGYDWPPFDAETVRFYQEQTASRQHVDGSVFSSEAVTQHMESWAAENWTSPPATSTVRKRVSAVIKQLRTAQER